MQVTELRLQRFRNYTEQTIRPGAHLNILVGANAQGKSNLLEAIYLLATTRSLRAGRESEMVQEGEDSAVVDADISRQCQDPCRIVMTIFPSERKSAVVNGVRRQRVIELLGQVNAVFFGSVDLGIVTADPSMRRRYLNIEISQMSPKYCFDYASYKRTLEQRNRLLKDLRERSVSVSHSGLEAWDEQLVRYAAPVIEKRRLFVARLAPIADAVHQELTDGKESLEVRYVPSFPAPEETGPEPIAEAMRRALANTRPDEIRRGVTLLGPQRDDLQFRIGGKDARTYGSQGQQRTVVLSLKLAEYRLLEEYIQEPPIVLLDDVMSDLDDERRRHLIEWVRRSCQTFVTCTNLSTFPADVLAEAAVFRVIGGSAARETMETGSAA